MIYDNATTPDKTYALEEGSVHVGTECTACEALLGLPQPTGPGTFGYFGDTLDRTYDFMTEWLNARDHDRDGDHDHHDHDRDRDDR